jgi:hypothetical protein
MKTLDELFHYARNYGSPDAQEIVKAWDDLTDHSPEFVIETAQEHLDQKFDADERSHQNDHTGSEFFSSYGNHNPY